MIMELGMPQDQVEAALRTARGNPNLAMELLMRGGSMIRGQGLRRKLLVQRQRLLVIQLLRQAMVPSLF
jgi:hypothetical protein